MNKVLLYIIIIIITLIIDFIWIYSNRNNYNLQIKKVQGFNLELNFIGAILSYICVIAGLFLFSFPLILNEYEKNKKQSLFLLSLRYGGCLGLIMYGIFNTTNIGLFKNYDSRIAIMDTLWGSFLFTLISYIFINLHKYYS